MKENPKVILPGQRHYCTHCQGKFYSQDLRQVFYPLLRKTAFHCHKCMSAYPDKLHTFISAKSGHLLELFSGSKAVSNTFQTSGYSTCTIDNNPKLFPDICADISTLRVNDIPNRSKISFIWASLPCTVNSVLNSHNHWKKIHYSHRKYYYTPTTNEARASLRLLEKTLHIIRSINPKYYVIENPRGVLRHQPQMKTIPFRDTVSYSSYGIDLYKPTDLFHNIPGLQLAKLTGSVGKTFTLHVHTQANAFERSKVPPALIQEIIKQTTKP